jgi:MFS family permease
MDDRPIAELVRDLSSQASTLARQELELARIELTEKGKHAGKGAGMFGVAAVLGLFAFGAITAGLILLLAEAVDAWLAALIVGVVYALIAGIVALVGRREVDRATPPLPERATVSVREDVAWTRTRAKAGRA